LQRKHCYTISQKNKGLSTTPASQQQFTPASVLLIPFGVCGVPSFVVQPFGSITRISNEREYLLKINQPTDFAVS
jgi:hypothetical protein